jgi:dihydrolipoamide dehydrogenase
VPQAIQDGFTAATNAVKGAVMKLPERAAPIGSFTDPEYAQVGLTEATARKQHDIVIERIAFDSTTRAIIDGRTSGFCKLIVDRPTRKNVGCHVVGERAVEITQVAAVAMAGGMIVGELAQVPLSFPSMLACSAEWRQSLRVSSTVTSMGKLTGLTIATRVTTKPGP